MPVLLGSCVIFIVFFYLKMFELLKLSGCLAALSSRWAAASPVCRTMVGQRFSATHRVRSIITVGRNNARTLDFAELGKP